MSGGTQSTAVSTSFGLPLKVLALDALDQPVSGVAVTFTAPGAGASCTLNAAATQVVNTGKKLTFTDDFIGTAGQTLSAHDALWTIPTGAQVIVLTGNAGGSCVGNAASTGLGQFERYTGVPVADDYYAHINFKVLNDAAIAVGTGVRATAAGQLYEAYYECNDAGGITPRIVLRKNSTGDPTTGWTVLSTLLVSRLATNATQDLALQVEGVANGTTPQRLSVYWGTSLTPVITFSDVSSWIANRARPSIESRQATTTPTVETLLFDTGEQWDMTARSAVPLANATSGTYTVVASAAGLSPVAFSLTNGAAGATTPTKALLFDLP